MVDYLCEIGSIQKGGDKNAFEREYNELMHKYIELEKKTSLLNLGGRTLGVYNTSDNAKNDSD